MSTGRSGETSLVMATACAAPARGASDAAGPGAIVAAGNSFLSASTSALTDFPTSTKQSPLEVAATSTRPSGVSIVVQSMVTPRPPRPYVAGRMPGSRMAPYRRLGDPYPASYI